MDRQLPYVSPESAVAKPWQSLSKALAMFPDSDVNLVIPVLRCTAPSSYYSGEDAVPGSETFTRHLSQCTCG